MTENTPETSGGLLEIGECHPAAQLAMIYIRNLGLHYLVGQLISFRDGASCGNRIFQVCAETLDRVINNQEVSDRYLLGLAWILKINREVYDYEEKELSNLNSDNDTA